MCWLKYRDDGTSTDRPGDLRRGGKQMTWGFGASSADVTSEIHTRTTTTFSTGEGGEAEFLALRTHTPGYNAIHRHTSRRDGFQGVWVQL